VLLDDTARRSDERAGREQAHAQSNSGIGGLEEGSTNRATPPPAKLKPGSDSMGDPTTSNNDTHSARRKTSTSSHKNTATAQPATLPSFRWRWPLSRHYSLQSCEGGGQPIRMDLNLSSSSLSDTITVLNVVSLPQ
jgi:hypothetical protein